MSLKPPASTDAPAPPARPARPRWQRRLAATVLTLAGLALLWTLVLTQWLPGWARQRVEAEAAQALGTPVSLERIDLHPWTLTLTLKGLRVGPADDPLLSLAGAQARLSRETFWRRAPVLERLSLDQPRLWIRREAAQRFNFSPVLEHLRARQASEPPAPPDAEPARFALHNIELTGGRIDYDDRVLGQQHRIEALSLGLPFISNLSSDVAVDVLPRLEARIDGSPLTLQGRTRPFAPGQPTRLSLGWQQVDLRPWDRLLQATLPAGTAPALKAGQLDTELDIDFEAATAPAVPRLVVRGSLELRDIDLDLPAQGAGARWTSLRLKGLDLAPLQGLHSLEALEIDGLKARYTLVAARSPAPAAAPRPARPPVSAASSASAPPVAATAAEAAPALRWKIGTVRCTDCLVQVRDGSRQPATTFELQRTNLTLEGLSEDPTQALRYTIDGALASAAGPTAGAAGPIRLQGELRRSPLDLDTTLQLAGIDLRVAQPYIAPQVNLVLGAGTLAAQGRLTLQQVGDAPLQLHYTGRAGVAGLDTRDSVTGADFVGWKQLGFDGLDIDWRAARLDADLGQISLDGLQARLILHPDAHLNVSDIVRHDEQAAPKSLTTPQAASAPAKAAAPADTRPANSPQLRWQGIRIQRSAVHFSDFFIRPNYSARLTKLDGKVSALSSAALKPARVELAGALDDGAPLRIAGTLHPLGAQLHTDIEASARGIALPRLSPYAERYAGYGIDKGSMSVTLRYRIDEGRLQADNQVFLDQLTFGAAVDSPDATRLPVLLAVSLMKNRRGEIDLQLPVSGSLDDPQFSVGGVIWKLVLNLLTRAATAPFALLMGGDGEEMAQVDFAPGSAELDAPARERLDRLATQLADRPQLKLEATGQADPARDADALRDQAARTAKATPATTPAVAPATTAAAASAPARAASAAATEVPTAALLALADRRADQVMAYLVSRLPAERILVNRSQVAAVGASAEVSTQPRVQFMLR